MKRLLTLVVCLVPAVSAHADEGMWTLDNFPSETVQAKYGVEIDDEWLRRVQVSTTRLEGGCSGSFVSPNGLVLTNHHCARSCVAELSTAEEDLLANGFLAKSHDEERKCQSEQLSVLMEYEDITEQVLAATEGKSEQDANVARKQVLTNLEQACEESSIGSASGKLSCESVNLYNGGQYFLYKYKRYEDVRLVFAPEADMASFGGDPDNFNFPRWCVDMAFLRAYEDGKPASTPSFLSWRSEGASEGEAVFVSGHPGTTDRLLTMAEIKHQRSTIWPSYLRRYVELRGRMIQYGKTSEEARRITRSRLQRIENSLKVVRNYEKALLDDELMARKEIEEQELRAAVAADPQLQSQYGSAWDEIAEALAIYRTFRDEYLYIEAGVAFNSELFGYARDLVRVAAEREKPNEDRYREYTESALPGLRQRALAERPIYPDLEELTLSFSLDKMREILGPDSPFVHQILGVQSPDSLAAELVSQTKLADPEYRKQLWEGGQSAIDASTDPMIRLAAEIDPESRALRKRYEDEVEAPQDLASEKIAKARFAILGTEGYPDATFTLRVTYGSVDGWEEKGEKIVPFTVTEQGLERATGEPPFLIPPKWEAARSELGKDTRFNFVATTDITGGNSGSPMIDKDANLIGLAFDGNIHSIAGQYWFDLTDNRTVGVHPAIMLEALGTVYGADNILEELGQE